MVRIKDLKSFKRLVNALLVLVLLLTASAVLNVFLSFQVLKQGYKLQQSQQALNANIEDLKRFLQASQELGIENSQTLKNRSINVFKPVELSIPIVAVSTDGEGVVGNLTLKLIPGNNNVFVDTNPFVDFDIQYSVNTAVTYAKLFVKNYNFDKDFVFSYKVPARVVGGPSAGAATAILTIAALEGKRLKPGVAITGTINPDGSIGPVGGILEKAKAVADAGFEVFLVPKGQSVITYYERVTEKHSLYGFDILSTRYVPKTLDLKQAAKKEWGLTIIEVSNVSEALKYFID